MVSYLEVCLPKKPPTPNNIGGGLSSPQRQFWREALFVKYDKNRNFILFFHIPPQSNPSLKEQKSYINSLLLVIRKVTILMHGNFLHVTLKMGVLRLNVLNLINHTVQWNMQTHSESTLLLHLCID